MRLSRSRPTGDGTVLVDFVSLMRADVRSDGMLRPDLLAAIADLAPAVHPLARRIVRLDLQVEGRHRSAGLARYHPNEIWGGYSDYYGFGTDEFLGLSRKLGTEPMIVLPAPDDEPKPVEYAMDWVHYLNDRRRRSGADARANGHPEPYGVRYFQIDNEPMNNGFTPERYAEVVNLYGGRLRQIAPDAGSSPAGRSGRTTWCGARRSLTSPAATSTSSASTTTSTRPRVLKPGCGGSAITWSKLRDYMRASAHPGIRIAVLEWNLSRTYDWRAGLHAAGSLILYEELRPELTMTCPALLMRNTTDDPTWTAFIYHDHVSWFPGAAYVVEKLFREHTPRRTSRRPAARSATSPNARRFFDEISQMKPEAWQPGTVDAIATASADGRRIVIKAVNYSGSRQHAARASAGIAGAGRRQQSRSTRSPRD